MPDKWIYGLEELGQEFCDTVGKKCANLGEMAKVGLRVPPGFALTLTAYEDFMRMSGAGQEVKDYLKSTSDIDSITRFNEVSQDLRDIVNAKEIPPEMKQKILSGYRELCSRCNIEDVAVATRSAGAKSHPGQYETHLNVQGESELLKNIKKVWASSFNPRSLSARKQRDLPLESDPIGVAVLKMVKARCAGVLFTADPNTGDKSRMIIEANWGLGESVVGGNAMPDMFVLDKEKLTPIEKKMGTKKCYVVFKDLGVAEEPTPADMCQKYCINDEELKEIGRLGKILEAHFKVPQDTEWAIDEDFDFPENVMLLQTRPEIIAEQKAPVDQVLDMMLTQFGS
jgi:pyruvate, water dikinase